MQATGINVRHPQDSLQSEWNGKLEEKFQNIEEKKIIKRTKTLKKAEMWVVTIIKTALYRKKDKPTFSRILEYFQITKLENSLIKKKGTEIKIKEIDYLMKL